MKVCVLTLLAANALLAADPQQLALALKAESEFDRVELAPTPRLSDTALCVQSQAAMIPLSTPLDAPSLYFRRGYCTLAGAALTGDRREYEDAAADFDRAIKAWPARGARARSRRRTRFPPHCRFFPGWPGYTLHPTKRAARRHGGRLRPRWRRLSALPT